MRPLTPSRKGLFFIIILFYFVAASAQDAQYYYNKGEEFLKKPKYEDAIANYTKAISLDASFASAYYKRGVAYYRNKQYDNGIKDISKAISLAPDSSSFYFHRGNAYGFNKNPDSAILDYTTAIKLEKPSAYYIQRIKNYYQYRGDLYQRQRMYESAILDYSKLINLDNRKSDYYRQRCKTYFYNNKIDSALQDISKAFSIDTINYLNNNYRGLCYNSLGNYEQSILDFLTCVINLPDDGTPYINIISPLVRLKRFKEAAVFYNSFIEKKSYKEQNARPGDKKFESFLSKDQYKFYNNYTKAVTQVADERWNEALVSLDSASKQYGTEPKDETKRLYADVLVLNGYVLEKLGRLEDAIVNYEQSLLIDPRQPDTEIALDSLRGKLVLTRSLNNKPPEIKILTANVQKKTRGFTIEADSTVTRVQLIGEAKDDSGLDSVKINGAAVNFDPSGVFFSNLSLKDNVTSITITASDKQKNKTSQTFSLDNLSNVTKPLAFSASDAPSAGKYYAVLIAEKDYADPSIPDLRTPIRDANLLKEVLIKQYTFDRENIDTLYNRSREDIIEAIIARCKKMTNKDNLLIFYAGHGDTSLDKMGRIDGYLVPSSAKKKLTSYYITSQEIFKALLRSNAKHILLLLDACYSGTFTRKVSPDVPNDIKKQYELDSRKVMSSGNVEEVPDNSEFIFYVIKYLKENASEKYVSAKDLWENVSHKIKQTLAQYAPIDEAGDFGGQFIFEKRIK